MCIEKVFFFCLNLVICLYRHLFSQMTHDVPHNLLQLNVVGNSCHRISLLEIKVELMA